MEKVNKWVYGYNDYSFGIVDYFDTKEDAIEEGKHQFEGNFYVGQLIKSHYNNIRVLTESILEGIAENIYDEVGEIAEGYLYRLEQKQEDELEEMVRLTIGKWMDKHDLRPNFYTVDNIELVEVD